MKLEWQFGSCDGDHTLVPQPYANTQITNNNGPDRHNCVKKQYRTDLNYWVTMDVCAIRCVAGLMASNLNNQTLIVSHANHTYHIILVGEIFCFFYFLLLPYIAFLWPKIVSINFFSHC